MFAGKRFLVCAFFLLFIFSETYAQKTKAQLQKEKQQNQQKIAEVEKIITETAATKKNSIGELNALNQRIKQQEELIHSIKGEIGLLDSEIYENNDIIEALERDLKKLKKEYASMLYVAQKMHNSITPLTFLFSAESFDELMTRLHYMEQYAEARRLQAEQIVKVQDELSGQVKLIQNRRVEKNKLLGEQVAESDNLGGLKRKQSSIIKSLEKEEKELKHDLEETKKLVAELDRKIEEVIREEIAREAAKTTKSKEVVALSSSFEENKSKLPWPVSGFVSQKFGRQNHAVLKGVVLQNQGVNIQTQESAKVKSIFEGVVSTVAVMPTLGNSVIIKHGDYFTVYACLKQVFVRTGQKVTTNQEIGEVLTNSEGVSELRFRIYKDRTPLDPENWLKNM